MGGKRRFHKVNSGLQEHDAVPFGQARPLRLTQINGQVNRHRPGCTGAEQANTARLDQPLQGWRGAGQQHTIFCRKNDLIVGNQPRTGGDHLQGKR